MIDATFVQSMARYNAWQNRQLKTILKPRGEAWARRTGAGFFGSIFATLNHIAWADAMWMGRIAGGEMPDGGIAQSVAFTPTLAEWEIARFRLDARILHWADNLRSTELTGDLSYHSVVLGGSVSKSRAACVVHMFNHQTHHRGQVHAMLTEAGVEAPVSDLLFMPDEGPYL